jgi:hypothetical protein
MMLRRSHPRLLPVAAVLVVGYVVVVLGTADGARDRGLRPIAGGSFEASGVAHVPGTDGVLFLDDQETREIFWMELASDGTQRTPAQRVPLGADVTDPEGITTNGSHFFVVGSQSKSRGFDGEGLVRFRFDAGRRRVQEVESVRDLKGFLAEHVAELHGTARKIGDEVLNIEGLAWDQRGERLLLGLRAPVVDGQALIVPLRMRDRSLPFSRENLQVDEGGAMRLPLGGVGVRSLEYDDRSGAYRVITGAVPDPETEAFRLLEWHGDAGASELRELATFSRKLKPEGITHAVIGGRDVSVLVFDSSHFLLMN